MTRLAGVLAGAVVACAAFLGGQAIAGGGEHATKTAPRTALPAGSVPAVVGQAGAVVDLPVVSVRQLPALAPPHRKAVVKSPSVTDTPTIPQNQAPQNQQFNPNPNPNPNPPAQPQNTTPNNGSGGNGNGGYFDDSG